MNACGIKRGDKTLSSKRLLAFFALTFAWSWSCWLLAPELKSSSSNASSVLFFLGGFGPSIAAVVVVGATSGRAGLGAWLRRCLRRTGWDWLALAALAPLAILALAAAAHIALGGSLKSSPALQNVPLLLANVVLVFLVGGPLGEELGWRGLALPVMLQRLGWRASSLVLGGIWGLWHLPLFFIAGSAQHQGSMPAFFVLIVATSVFYTWLFKRSAGSILPVLALHTASNSWPAVIPILPSDQVQRPYLFVVGIVLIAAIWLLVRQDNPAVKLGDSP